MLLSTKNVYNSRNTRSSRFKTSVNFRTNLSKKKFGKETIGNNS